MNNSNNANNSNATSQTNNTTNPNLTPTSSTDQVNQNTTVIQPENSINQQMSNSIPNNNSSQSITPQPINNGNMQSNMPPNQNINMQFQNNAVNVNSNDEELLRAFIGNNYDKITTKRFNFAGFFFTTCYLFYRKMFLYGLLFFLINFVIVNIIKSFIINLLLCIVVGFFVNKIYLHYAKKKIAKIKLENPQKNIEELKSICSNKGGTSVGKIFLGFLAEIGISLVILIVVIIAGFGSIIGSLFDIDKWNITINDNENNSNLNNSSSTKDGILLEDVIVSGHSCFGSKCNISIKKANDTIDYVLDVDNSDLIISLNNYSDYVKLDIYYTEDKKEKIIINYKIYLRSTNEDISNIKTEKELRDKLGLYSIGTHTASLTLLEIGKTGVGFDNDTSYTYIEYTFVDSKNNEYEMRYINPKNINLIEGNKYMVTFEVVEDTFGYEFNIKSIE